MDKIIIKGASENNLKKINLELPKNKLIVMTGVSGSGKSSLAFDTIYAEGQRRYIESLSAYARQFLGGSEKPKVDSIEGLSPSISIDQKTTSKNPRSTIGTVTEIYDYLRLLYARIGVPYCPTHHIPITSQSIEEMVNQVMKLDLNQKIRILSPIVYGQKGTHKDVLDKIKKEGFLRIRVNGNEYEIEESIKLDKNQNHNIEIIIDRLIMKPEIRSRLHDSIELAANLGHGKVIIDVLGASEIIMSEKYACPHCDFSLPELEPRMFSFNAPYGACSECKGLGIKLEIDPDLIVPNKELSINEGAIVALNHVSDNIYFSNLKATCQHYKIDLKKPFKKLTKKEIDTIFYGSKDKINFSYISKSGRASQVTNYYEGVIHILQRRYMETKSTWIREWISQYMTELVCPTCHGSRLNEGVLSVLIDQKNIYQLTLMSIGNLDLFFNKLKLSKEKETISAPIIKEIRERLRFLINVGLNYLTLSRPSKTLSGGEAQRIRLATQIGSRLTGVLYVLDEPSIGLHQRDNQRLINSLMEMRDLGNTLIVVEHDIETMLASDYIVDVGPGAGIHGGEIVGVGTPTEIMEMKNSLTGKYLKGVEEIPLPLKRRKSTKFIEIKGASENNLKKIDVKIPLGIFTCITGVSGSGKSTLVREILYKAVANNLYKSKGKPGKHQKIIGLEKIDKIIEISQSPIGRTPRSNPATYTGVFDEIREVFASTKEAKKRGYKKGRFSFNIKGGRCEACRGDGVKKIEMHFLPDVYVPCEVCHGTRYNKETLEIKFKGKNIKDVLEMRVEEALTFFENIPKAKQKLQMLEEVGLSYIKLGQSATTLSGGEASRIKLAKELQKKATGKTMFILDEPTTGLHSDDVKKLLKIINRIVDNGDSVVVIEHNLDVIKTCDYIIDLGKEGGDQGGYVIAQGTPETISKVEDSYTGMYLKNIFRNLNH